MKYPTVIFKSAAFSKEMPEDCDPDSWFAGKDLAKSLTQYLKKTPNFTFDKRTELIDEDWGWCVCLKVDGESFFLGVGEDWDEDRDWKIFIAKDFDLIARIFRKKKLTGSVNCLKLAISDFLSKRSDVSEVTWE